MIERFFRSLKEECIWQHNFTSFGEARRAVRRWIRWYNDERPHQALAYKSPTEFRRDLNLQQVGFGDLWMHIGRAACPDACGGRRGSMVITLSVHRDIHRVQMRDLSSMHHSEVVALLVAVKTSLLRYPYEGNM